MESCKTSDDVLYSITATRKHVAHLPSPPTMSNGPPTQRACIANASVNTCRSSIFTSTTLVSNVPCRVRALDSSFACKKAKPKELHNTPWGQYAKFKDKQSGNSLVPYVSKLWCSSHTHNQETPSLLIQTSNYKR